MTDDPMKLLEEARKHLHGYSKIPSIGSLLSRIDRYLATGGWMQERIAQLTAHRACGNQEQDTQNGKLAGYCVICQTPWPCEFAGKPLPKKG